jgi:pilus assembly protein CpaB
MARSLTAGGFVRSDRTIMLAAILLAAIAAVLVFIAANSGGDGGSTVRPIDGGPGTVQVVTVARNIPANTTITEDMIQVTSLPAAAILAQAYTSGEGLIGQTTRYPLLAGEQITPNKIGASVEDDESAALLVRPGNRAISIAIGEDTAVGGLLLPGDFVDVIAVFDDNSTGVAKAVTIVQNVEVIAVGQDKQEAIPRAAGEEPEGGTYGEIPDNAEPNPNANSLTLSVTPEQAQIIALAAKEASLVATLRARGDTAGVDLPESNLDRYQTAGAATEG